MHIDVYFDFICPFAFAASVWLAEVQRRYTGELTIRWKFFSLEQANSLEGPQWNLWEQPLTYRSRSLLPFRVAAGARQTSDELYERVIRAIFEARHIGGQRINDPDVLTRVLNQAGLDGQHLIALAAHPATAQILASDHTEAVEKYNVFGTPTLVVDGQHAAYVKIHPAPQPAEALKLFEEVITIVVGRPNLYEIKRPGTGQL